MKPTSKQKECVPPKDGIEEEKDEPCDFKVLNLKNDSE